MLKWKILCYGYFTSKWTVGNDSEVMGSWTSLSSLEDPGDSSCQPFPGDTTAPSSGKACREPRERPEGIRYWHFLWAWSSTSSSEPLSCFRDLPYEAGLTSPSLRAAAFLALATLDLAPLMLSPSNLCTHRPLLGCLFLLCLPGKLLLNFQGQANGLFTWKSSRHIWFATFSSWWPWGTCLSYLDFELHGLAHNEGWESYHQSLSWLDS